MADVFISHSSKDKETADKVVAYLEERGIKCWISSRDIVVGSSWASSISNAITTTKIFLLIYSENSAASEQCSREIDIAETIKDVVVAPYKIDDAPLTGSFLYYLTGAHWIKADVKNNEYRLEDLYVVISGILGKPVQNIEKSTNTDEPVTDMPSSSEADMPEENVQPVEADMPEESAQPDEPDMPEESAQSDEPDTPEESAQSDEADTPEESAQSDEAESPEESIQPDEPDLPEESVQPYERDLREEHVQAVKAVPAKKAINKKLIVFGSIGIAAAGIAVCLILLLNKPNEPVKNIETSESSAVSGDAETPQITETSESPEVSDTDDTLNDYELKYKNDKLIGTYTGELNADGLPEGKGKFVAKLNNITSVTIEGSFSGGQLNGESTVKEVCEGTYTYDYTVANFKDGLFDGKVILVTEDEKLKYHGEAEENYIDGVLSGYSTHENKYYNGDTFRFEGNYEHSFWNGECKEYSTYVVGSDPQNRKIISYEGEYKDGKRCGTGKMYVEYWNGMTYTYEGEFENNHVNGKATCICTIPESLSKDGRTTETYTGEFTNDTYNGDGVIITDFNNGNQSIYEGKWVNGIMKGKFKITNIYASPEDYGGKVKDVIYVGLVNEYPEGYAEYTINYNDGTVLVYYGDIKDDVFADGTTVIKYEADGVTVTNGIVEDGYVFMYD